MEVMIAAVIASILAAIALPAYGNYVKRGQIAEATTNLASLRVSMEQYFQDNRTYLNGAACGATMPVAPQVRYFTITCAATNATYTITATGTGSMAGFAYTIDQQNAKTSNITAPDWSNPNPNNCWAIKQGGAC